MTTYLLTMGLRVKNNNLNMSDRASRNRNNMVMIEHSGNADANRVTYCKERSDNSAKKKADKQTDGRTTEVLTPNCITISI